MQKKMKFIEYLHKKFILPYKANLYSNAENQKFISYENSIENNLLIKKYRNNDEIINLKYKLLDAKDIKQFYFVYKMCINEDVLKSISFNDQLKLINTCLNLCEKYSYKLKNIYEIISNPDLLQNRTIDEVIEIICKYEKVKYPVQLENIKKTFSNKNIWKMKKNNELLEYIDKCSQIYDSRALKSANKIYTNLNVLKNRTNNEQLQLIDKIINEEEILEKYNHLDENKLLMVFTNEFVLENRTNEEQLSLIDKCVDIYDYDVFNQIYNIIISPNVLKNRTIEEQIKLINMNLSIKNNKMSNKINQLFITNPLFLDNLSFDEQIKIMFKISRTNPEHFELINKFYQKNYELPYRSKKEIDEIFDKLLRAKANDEFKTLASICTNETILTNRTFDEQIELMNNISMLYEKNGVDSSLNFFTDEFIFEPEKAEPYCKKKKFNKNTIVSKKGY